MLIVGNYNLHWCLWGISTRVLRNQKKNLGMISEKWYFHKEKINFTIFFFFAICVQGAIFVILTLESNGKTMHYCR